MKDQIFFEGPNVLEEQWVPPKFLQKVKKRALITKFPLNVSHPPSILEEWRWIGDALWANISIPTPTLMGSGPLYKPWDCTHIKTSPHRKYFHAFWLEINQY